jgi:glycosyltransferase involved in cell wall biosynthesis
MVRVGVYTMDPVFGGGVLSLGRSCYELEERLGHSPSLVYMLMSGANGVVPPARDEDPERELSGVRRAPVRPPMSLKSWTLRQWSCIPSIVKRLNDADALIGVAGSASALFPLAVQSRPYACWVATSLEDELRGQAGGGGQAAARILNSTLRLRHALWLERRVLRRAAVILVTSAHTRAIIGARYPEVVGRLRVVMPQLHLPAARSGVETPREKVVLSVGRLTDPRKNIPLLLNAFARVADAYPAWTLALAGEEPNGALRELSEKMGVSGRTRWLGRVSSDRLRELYGTAGVFVLPSLQEGLGIVLLEAMATGLPVIATRCGGPEEVIRDRETGVLVRNDDVDALTAELDALLGDALTRERIGSAGRVIVRDRFSVERVAEQYSNTMADAFPEHYDSFTSVRRSHAATR